MTLTTEHLRQWFASFNTEYFGGELPEPVLKVSNSRTMLGQFRCRRQRKWPFGRNRMTDFTIKVSAYYDTGEREYRNTLLHEMIHYHIAYHGLKDTSPHGKTFRAIMERLNREHGWDIRVSTPARKWVVAERNVRAGYDVLVINAADGRRLVAVANPAYRERLDAMARRTRAIAGHRWYTSGDAFFASFPRVRTLRGRVVTESELTEKILPLCEEAGT